MATTAELLEEHDKAHRARVPAWKKLVLLTIIFGGGCSIPLIAAAQFTGMIDVMALFANPV